MSEGTLLVNGMEVKYMPGRALEARGDRYVDTYGLLPLLHRLCFDSGRMCWDPVNILLTGPKGTGKSLFLASFARENQIPYLALDCSEETKERHLRGGFVVKSGTTPFVLGALANALVVANETGAAMLVLEEINALSPQRQKELNAITDFRKKVEIPELSWRIELAPGAKLFIAGTMNPSVYGGTYELNEDLKSRFFEIDVPYPPAAEEKKILREIASTAIPDELLDKLVQIAQETRQEASQYALSTRDLVELVKAAARVGWEDALFLAAQKFSVDDRKLILERIKDATRVSVPATLADYARARGHIV